MTLAELIIVRIVGRRYLHRTGAEFGVDVFVGDDGNFAVRQRQKYRLADKVFVSLVLRIHCDRSVAEHCLRTGRRDGDRLVRFP